MRDDLPQNLRREVFSRMLRRDFDVINVSKGQVLGLRLVQRNDAAADDLAVAAAEEHYGKFLQVEPGVEGRFVVVRAMCPQSRVGLRQLQQQLPRRGVRRGALDAHAAALK